MLALGTILQNRYRILRQLGQGGMGTVYEATDERFDSQVALKETHFTEEVLRKQFEREARLLNKLRHPAMTRVIDYFSEAGGQFLVMDYVHGEDLGAALERNKGRPFPLDEVLSWGDQLLDALDYIHSQTPPIIHRDIKPHNLKLTERNQIILLDFGLAKGSVGGMTTVATTRSVLGYSLSYAPLEQILKVEEHWIELLSVTNAEQVEKILKRGTDQRSDLYSLAATLLHLMTGKAPPNAPTRALSVWTGRPDSLQSAFNYGIPAAIAEVLTRAMTITLDERFTNAAEMRKALREVNRPQMATSRIEAKAETLPPTVVGLSPTTIDLPPTQYAVPPAHQATLRIPTPHGMNPAPTEVLPHNVWTAHSTLPSTPSKALVICSYILLVAIVIATIAVFAKVATILVSGPVLSILGLIVAMVGIRHRNTYGIIFGFSAPVVSLLCLAIIRIFQLGPSTALRPLSFIAAVYLAISVGLGLATIRAAKGPR